MTKKTSAYKEVSKFVTDKINAGLIVRVEWLTEEIISHKSDIEGDDTPFYIECAQYRIHKIIKDCIGVYKPKPRSDEQLVLKGFEHLQKAYPVKRDGVQLLIPVHQLSDAELKARADEYATMSKGCLAHAGEIRRFIRKRKTEQDAA